MLPDLELGEEFFAELMGLDAEIARQVAAAGCAHCGGPLHQANYGRKPRGGVIAVAGEGLDLRHSLCCGREGCRKRALPPSLRFLGRRVYVEVVVLLASVVAQLAAALRDARAQTGVPARTLRRWGAWWRQELPQSAFWASLRARFAPPPPAESELPHSLVTRLEAELVQAASGSSLADVCRFGARLLAPITTRSVADGARFLRAVGGSSATV
jgi:hypothetical protein